jgi:hypothetical protein
MVLGGRHDREKLVLAIHRMGGECWVGQTMRGIREALTAKL